VRDPFTLKHLLTVRMLRRASCPLARIYRDFGLNPNPLTLILLGTAILLGVAFFSLPGSFSRQAPVQPRVLPTTRVSM
jgi:hypothetical protein